MAWIFLEHPDFSEERHALPANVVHKLAEIIRAIEQVGPFLGRPLVDTLDGSGHHNMKEIRFNIEGAWRFAFAFDPERHAIILCGGNKEGVSSAKFYKAFVRVADQRFDDWLETEE